MTKPSRGTSKFVMLRVKITAVESSASSCRLLGLRISKEDIFTLAGAEDINCKAITSSSVRRAIQIQHLTRIVDYLHHMAVVEDK